MPPFPTHHIANFQDIDPSTLLCPESDDGHRRVTEDVEFRNLGFDSVDNLPSGSDNIHGRLAIATAATS